MSELWYGLILEVGTKLALTREIAAPSSMSLHKSEISPGNEGLTYTEFVAVTIYGLTGIMYISRG
jgi:hypothetical protein